MPTVVRGSFEWDSDKAWSNIRKHGVSFNEARTAISDVFAVFVEDAVDPRRLLGIGMSNRYRILFVVSSDRNGRIRIISARKATHRERKRYEENSAFGA